MEARVWKDRISVHQLRITHFTLLLTLSIYVKFHEATANHPQDAHPRNPASRQASASQM
jgi:hypothetical protein